MLKQLQDDNTWRPVSYVSRSLPDVKARSYKSNKKRKLALRTADFFADFVISTEFTIVTDLKPLVTLLSPL